MFVNGVSVVLIGNKGSTNGMSISWATQIEKSHLVISLPKKSDITNRLVEEGLFSINILGGAQKEVAAKYGGRECRKSEYPASVDIEYVNGGVPTLKECCKSLVCHLIRHVDIENQVLCVCKVVSEETKGSDLPLVYEKSEYFK